MKRIGTHNGKFHADEAFACAMLQMTDGFGNSEIVRTRDEAVLAEMDIVVDVGGVYDAEKLKFDHHQRTFNQTFSPNYSTKLSSAGLVYKHFGKEIIGKHCEAESVETVYQKLYKVFVEPFDAHDNGISAYPSEVKASIEPAWNIFNQVNILNPQTDEGADERFLQAVFLVKSNFEQVLTYYCDIWLPARRVVRDLLRQNTISLDENRDQIIIFDLSCPWSSHLHDLEMELGKKYIYAIYPDGMGASWRVQAIPVIPGSFESRLSLPAEWRGLRDQELSELVGIEDCIFVHASGFIGGHKSKEGAIKMAKLALSKE